MSAPKKNPDNPFALLDSSRFPADRSQRSPRTMPAGSPGQSASAQSDARMRQAPEEQDENNAPVTEAALFLEAMRSTAPLPRSASKDDGGKKGRTGTKRLRPSTATTAPRPLSRSGSAPAFSSSAAQADPSGIDEGVARHSVPVEENRTTSLEGADADEDRRSFFHAVSGVTPLGGRGREIAPEPAPLAPLAEEKSNPLQDLVDGKVEFSLSATDEFVEGHVLGLDLLVVGRLQARHYSPEAHIDLHGLNSEQAFHAMVNFFRSAYYKGTRTALVVTGRGLNSPNGTPVLRSKVTQWFTQEPFRRVILAFCTAKREDGGPGALYVMLRKRRKNSGKVRWGAMPSDPDLFL